MTEEEKKKAAAKKAADKKEAVAKKAAAKKARAEKVKADKKEAAEKKVAEKAKAGMAKAEYVGKELKIELPGGAKFAGLCVCQRKINGGEQVFVKVKGQGKPSRFFNVEDIVK